MLISLIQTLVFLKNALNFWRMKVIYTDNKKYLTNEENMSNFMTQSGDLTSNTITFKPGDKKYYYDITEENVTVYISNGSHDHGSSKVKLKNLVDYKWEVKNYPGHLIAVHSGGNLIAYVIKVHGKSGVQGMVRVANVYSAPSQRALIKGMKGEILDLQFAHIDKDFILGFIEENMLHIYQIDVDASGNLACKVLLSIEDPIQGYTPKYDKITWCPYVATGSRETIDDASEIIVWSRGNCFQCFNVSLIIKGHGIGQHVSRDLTEGHIKFSENSMTITWIALSPDGTTLGVGSEDGYIRFYQLYFHEEEPRCLHQWIPHEGKAVSSFYFLDNLSTPAPSSDNFWKYAITAADRNTEFKVWDCETWECLQTVSLKSHENKNTGFIAEIDRTSSYLVLSNIGNRSLYVLQIINDCPGDQTMKNDSSVDSGSLEKSTKTKASCVFIKSICEFPLSSPMLSLSIADAAVRKYKCGLSDNYLLDELDDYDEDCNALYCVVVRMFSVQPKSVQECHVLYQPTLVSSAEVKSSISNESSDYKDAAVIEDLSSKMNSSQEQSSNSDEGSSKLIEKSLTVSPAISKLSVSSEKINSTQSPRPASTQKQASQINLMTPDAFSTTVSTAVPAPVGKKTPECVSSEVLSTILMLASVTGSSTSNSKNTESLNLLNLVNNKMIEDQEHQKFKQAMESQKNSEAANPHLTSGGSSPSREVQEIFSLKDYKNMKYYIKESDKINSDLQSNKLPPVPQKASDIEKPLLEGNMQKAKEQSKPITDWPKVPDVRTVTKHSLEIQNSSNIIPSPNPGLNELHSKIDQLIGVIQIQSTQIAGMQKEIYDLRTSKNEINSKTIADKIEMRLLKLLEEFLKRYEMDHRQKLENFIAAKNSQKGDINDSVVEIINKIFFEEFIEKITSILKKEVQSCIVPVLANKLDTITQQIHKEVAQKLTTTDQVLKENIAQVCKSKSIIDAFGNSVLLGVQNGLQATYVETMSNTLIPAYEKSSQDMFRQIHDTFNDGVKDVMEAIDNYLAQLQPIQESTDEVLEQITEVRSQIEKDFNKLRTSNNNNILETTKEIKSIESNIAKILTETIQTEVRKGFLTQAATLEDSVLSVVRSQAQTPAPLVYDVQDQIKHLLSQGNINKAFHQALLANDLNLVEYTLEKADYKLVFNPCVLEQTVLLSLIQQISADMSNHNEIKQRYLSDGILNLNQHDPITKEHAPKVMKELYRNCQGYLISHPKSSLCSNIRMIMMAVQGMGYKIF